MVLQKADLILVRGNGPISRTIEDITHSPYSHVAGYVKDNELVEAQGFRRVGYQAIDFYDGYYNAFRVEGLTDKQRERVVHYVEQHIGERYDYLLLLIELVRYTFHIILPYHEYHSRICSTLWSDAYRYIGIDLCPGIRYPSPADLAESKLVDKL